MTTLPSNMSHCEKCGELIEWYSQSGWVHVHESQCLEFVWNESTVWSVWLQEYVQDYSQVIARVEGAIE